MLDFPFLNKKPFSNIRHLSIMILLKPANRKQLKAKVDTRRELLGKPQKYFFAKSIKMKYQIDLVRVIHIFLKLELFKLMRKNDSAFLFKYDKNSNRT